MDRYLYKLVVKIRTLFYDTEYEPYLKGCDINIYESDKVGRFGNFDIMEIDFRGSVGNKYGCIMVYHNAIHIDTTDKNGHKSIIARNLYDGFDGLLKLKKIDFSKFVDLYSNKEV